MIEFKYAEIRNLTNRGIFRAVIGRKQPYDATLITAKCILVIMLDKYKQERYKARCVAGGQLTVIKYYVFHGAQTNPCVRARII